MIRAPREAVMGREGLGQQLLLLLLAAAVVVQEARVVALVGSGAADAVDEDVAIGSGRRGRGPFLKVLRLGARHLLLVAPEAERVAGTGAAEPGGQRRRRGLLAVAIGVGGLSQRRGEVQVDGLHAGLAVALRGEAQGRRAENAAALAGAARAGVGAGWRGTVDAVAHAARGRRGREGVLPLAVAAAEDGQAGDQRGAAGAGFTHRGGEVGGACRTHTHTTQELLNSCSPLEDLREI